MAMCGECHSEVSILASRCRFCGARQPSLGDRIISYIVAWIIVGFIALFLVFGVGGLILYGISEFFSPGLWEKWANS